ncbi:MAG: hypothetical protein ACT4QG_03600 [Sporichthyaceae bacterium]
MDAARGTSEESCGAGLDEIALDRVAAALEKLAERRRDLFAGIETTQDSGVLLLVRPRRDRTDAESLAAARAVAEQAVFDIEDPEVTDQHRREILAATTARVER